MRNDRTPRTLAETQFSTGYPMARRQTHAADWVMYALAVAVLAAMGWGWL